MGVLCSPVRAQFALPFYEPFPATYTNGGAAVFNLDGVDYPSTRVSDTPNPSGTVWSYHSTIGNGSLLNVGGAALSYPGLYQTNGSVGLYGASTNITGGRDVGFPFVPVASGKLYASLLLNVRQWPVGENRVLVVLSTNSTITGAEQIGLLISCTNYPTDGITNRLYVVKHTSYTSGVTSNVPPQSPTIDAGSTHLIVMRYTFNHSSPSTNLDEIALWVDPGSLGAAEGGVPAPSMTETNGQDLSSLSSFFIFQHNQTTVYGSSFLMDEIRLGTTWADVTPTNAPCIRAFIAANPTNTSVVEGGMASFTTIGGGSDATFQWQVSTDGGTSWNPVAVGFGVNAPTLMIPSATMNMNGNKYRCQINAVSCGNTLTNSTAATLTVTAPVVTPPGVLVDDFFIKRDRLSGPINSTNSVWVTDTSGSLYENADPDPFMLVGHPQDSAACVWLGYFIESNVAPVHLDVGRVLQATLVFTSSGSQIGVTNGLRVGVYDQADAGIRFTADGTGVKNTAGLNVRGYMAVQDWEAPTFNADQPQQLYVRDNMADGNLMGTTGDYASLGQSPHGFLNLPAFSDGTTYTLDFYVARMAASRCSVCLNITGGGTNYALTVADRDYGYHRFDCIALRPNSLQSTASEFDFSEFKVQVLQIPPAPKVNISRSGPNVTLTWSNGPIYAPYRLENAAAVNGPYAPINGASSPLTFAAGGQAGFYRLVWP